MLCTLTKLSYKMLTSEKAESTLISSEILNHQVLCAGLVDCANRLFLKPCITYSMCCKRQLFSGEDWLTHGEKIAISEYEEI